MYFRNATPFRISPERLAGLGDWNATLADHTLRQCGPLEMRTAGFVSPLGDDRMTLQVGKIALFSLGADEKVLPAATVNEAVKAKLDAYAKETGRPAGGKKRRQVRAEVLDALLPRALTRPSRVAAYVDADAGWVVIDSASRKRGEEVLTALREAFGSFPAVPVATMDTAPGVVLTQWLAHPENMPEGLALGNECELKDPASGATVKCGKQELESREVLEHLKAGKRCVKLGLVLGDRVAFVLKEDLSLGKIRLLDVVLDSLDSASAEDAAGEYAARAALMTAEFGALLVAMAGWFGIVAPDEK